MPADVDEAPKLAILPADDHDRDLAGLREDHVSRLLQQRVVAGPLPAPRQDPLLPQPVDPGGPINHPPKGRPPRQRLRHARAPTTTVTTPHLTHSSPSTRR